ncbi:MAG: protein kinase [Planctomycetia bacterium]|nr:protein kinase [Planctomycetia bacterium]
MLDDKGRFSMISNSRDEKCEMKQTLMEKQATEISQITTTLDNADLEPQSNERIQGKFGRYEIVRIIGKGGMGEVYLAHDTVLDRQVAIKFPKFRGTDIAAQRERFRREARAAAALRHSGLCPVYDVGEEQGLDFLTMAYVEGPTLAELVKRKGPLPPHEAAIAIHQVASAMAFAHEHGFVHRDLKPTNIVMETETQSAIVLDFGLAKRISGDKLPEEKPVEEPITNEGAILGTPAYMPLEQYTGDVARIGPSADIYSLGLILFELLTGKRAFRDNHEMLQSAVRDEKLPSLLTLQPAIDPGLEAVYARASARLPEDRYSSMAEFATALEPFCQHKVSSRSRWKIASLLLGTVAAAVLIGIIIFTFTTSEGSVRVEISDAKAPVEIKLDGQIIQLNLDGKPLKVKPGRHQFTVSGSGFETTTTEFTAKAGEQATVKLTVQPLPVARNDLPAESKESMKEVARLTILLEEAQQRNDKPGVLRYASELLLNDPKNEDALLIRGQYRFERKEWDKALIDFNQCLEVNPKNAKALYQRSMTKYQTGQTKEALAGLDAVLQITPDFHEAVLQKSWFLGSIGLHENALALCNQAIAKNPESAEAFWKRASIQFARGEYPSAQEDMKAAIGLDARFRNQFPETLPDPPDWTPGDTTAPELKEINRWSISNNHFHHHVQIKPDGTRMAIGTNGGHLFVLDFQKGNIVYDQRRLSKIKATFRSDNQLIYSIEKATLETDKTIQAGVYQLDLQTGESERLFDCSTNGYPHALALSDDEKMLVVAGFTIKPHLWDFSSRKLVRTLDDAEGVIEGAAFSRDGRYVFTAAWDDLQKPVRMWDVSTGKEVRHFSGHVGGSIHLAISKKRDRILTCSVRDRTARLWDVDSGKELKRLCHPTGLVRVALSQDGRYALTISGWRHNPDGSIHALEINNPFPKIWPNQHDNILRLWDVETGRVIGRFKGGSAEMYSMAFTPDSSQAVVGFDRSIIYLDIASAVKQAAGNTLK